MPGDRAALDRAILELLRAGVGARGWHGIATHLSSRDVPRTPGLLEVLRELEGRGLIVRGPGEPGTWALTAAGLAALGDMG